MEGLSFGFAGFSFRHGAFPIFRFSILPLRIVQWGGMPVDRIRFSLHNINSHGTQDSRLILKSSMYLFLDLFCHVSIIKNQARDRFCVNIKFGKNDICRIECRNPKECNVLKEGYEVMKIKRQYRCSNYGKTVLY